MILTIISWLILSFGVAYLGDSRRIGFGWALFWSLIFSPVIGFAVVMASERKGTYEEELAKINGVKQPPAGNGGKDVVEQLEKLKRMLDLGAITLEEYEKAKKQVIERS